MNTYCGSRYSHPARLFSFGFLDVLIEYASVASLARSHGGLRSPYLETAFLNNPGPPML